MKSKKQIYEETQDMVLKQNTDNYMEYLRIYRQAFNSNVTQEEKDDIRKKAYKTYKRKEEQLEEILDLAYIDLMESSNRAII